MNNTKTINLVKNTLTLIMVLVAVRGWSQTGLKLNDQTPYYIDINNSEHVEIFEIQDGFLNLQYYDKYALTKALILKIFNWKQELVYVFKLDKELGLNNYTIDLMEYFSVQPGVVYTCSLIDENQNSLECKFIQVDPPKSDLDISIFVNPVKLKCFDPFQNLVQFYGNISKGRAPYKVTWYVINEARTDFLYQPREEQLDTSGQATVIEVDKSPAYLVMITVTDACGAKAQKMVYMGCEEVERKVNSVFVEPLKDIKSIKTQNIN